MVDLNDPVVQLAALINREYPYGKDLMLALDQYVMIGILMVKLK